MNQELDFSDIENHVAPVHRLILTITYPDKVVEKEIRVNKDKKITFGASEDSDVILTDNSIAPHHFSFYYDDEPKNIEKYEHNTVYKDGCFYAGLVKIKIEHYKAADYTPLNASVFKMITDGFSFKKTSGFFITLIFIYYISSLNDSQFFSNESSSTDITIYFTLWIMPNILLIVSGLIYMAYNYFNTTKNQRAFSKIIQQNILKYSIKLSCIYFLINIVLYVLNGFMNMADDYSNVMQTILIFCLYLISDKAIELNQYQTNEKKKITRSNLIFFLCLFIFSCIASFSTAYTTWLPIASPYNVNNNQDLEEITLDIIKDIKSQSQP